MHLEQASAYTHSSDNMRSGLGLRLWLGKVIKCRTVACSRTRSR